MTEILIKIRAKLILLQSDGVARQQKNLTTLNQNLTMIPPHRTSLLQRKLVHYYFGSVPLVIGGYTIAILTLFCLADVLNVICYWRHWFTYTFKILQALLFFDTAAFLIFINKNMVKSTKVYISVYVAYAFLDFVALATLAVTDYKNLEGVYDVSNHQQTPDELYQVKLGYCMYLTIRIALKMYFALVLHGLYIDMERISSRFYLYHFVPSSPTEALTSDRPNMGQSFGWA